MKIDFANSFRIRRSPRAWKVQKLREKKRHGKQIMEAVSLADFSTLERAVLYLVEQVVKDSSMECWQECFGDEKSVSVFAKAVSRHSDDLSFDDATDVYHFIDRGEFCKNDFDEAA